MAIVKGKKISKMSFKEIANLYGYKPQKYEDFCKTPEAWEYALDEENVKYYKDNFTITNDNVEEVLGTIGEEVKGLSKDEFNKEENSYYENLYKESVQKMGHLVGKNSIR